jgi:hypothetical protein
MVRLGVRVIATRVVTVKSLGIGLRYWILNMTLYGVYYARA